MKWKFNSFLPFTDAKAFKKNGLLKLGFFNSAFIWPTILSKPLTTLPVPLVTWILSIQGPGVYVSPYTWEAPLTKGIFSWVIIIYGLDSPSIFICLVPVKASEKLISIEGFVSKLSDKLQHAAFNNSSLLILVIFWALKYDLWRDFLLSVTSISSSSPRLLSFITCEMFDWFSTSKVSVWNPMKLRISLFVLLFFGMENFPSLLEIVPFEVSSQ